MPPPSSSAERRSHRDMVDSARNEMLTAQREAEEWKRRFEEAERTHAKERAQEAAAWQKARQALSEGISGEIDERRKAEVRRARCCGCDPLRGTTCGLGRACKAAAPYSRNTASPGCSLHADGDERGEAGGRVAAC